MHRSFAIILTLLLIVAGCGFGFGGDDASPTATAPVAQETAAVDPYPAINTSTPTAEPTLTAPQAASPVATQSPVIQPTVQPAQAVEPTPWAPGVQRPDDQRVLLPDLDLRYEVHVTEIDVLAGTLTAHQVIHIRALRDAPPEQLHLQVVPAGYGFFTLDSLTLNGEPTAPTWINDGFTLVVDLPEGITVPAEIGIDFHLNIGGPEPSGWGYMGLDADVLRLGYWFPQISDDHPFSLTLDPSYTRVATFDVTLDLTAGIDFAHSGELVDAIDLGDGIRRYVMHGENIRDFDFAISPGYQRVETTTPSGVRIEYYWRPGQTVDVTEQVLATTTDAVEQLTALLGPYPWPTLRVADAGPSMPGGIEFANMFWINPAYPQLDRLIYHEAAHMWFYGIIGTRTLVEGWVDEGAAEFFERGLPTNFTEVPPAPAGGYCCPLDSTWEDLPQEGRAYYFAVYEQGARFYYDVLWTMGWDPFWAAMQEIYADHRFEIVTAYDLLATWQRHSEIDLRPLYDEYFRYAWIDDLPGPGITSRQGWLPIE